jgi:lipoprotein NlpI
MAEEDIEIFNKQAMSYMGQGEYEKAIDFFDKIIAMDPMYTPAWNDKGVAFMEMKEFDQALECFEKVMTIDPTNSMPIYNMGYVFLILERYEDALQAFELFFSRYPGKDDFYRYALYLKAKAHYGIKEYEPAKDLLEKAILKDKLFKEARDLMIQILQEEQKNSTV